MPKTVQHHRAKQSARQRRKLSRNRRSVLNGAEKCANSTALLADSSNGYAPSLATHPHAIPAAMLRPVAVPNWLRVHWPKCVLSAIVLGAMALSLLWVSLVPVFEAPDENSHVDYVFSIYSVGHLIRAGDAPAASLAHPYTVYLTRVTGNPGHPEVRVPPGYGSAEFWAKLDKGAPRLGPHFRLRYAPGLLLVYPFGYYALAAVWLGVVSLFTSSLTALFFSVRILSVMLLACSLLLCYGIGRELRLPRWLALMLVAVIGFYPLTSFVSSAVQPDNLSFTLVSLCTYLALRIRDRPDRWWTTALLGLALGALLVTKYQFFGCVFVAVCGAALSGRMPRRRRKVPLRYVALFFIVPCIVTGLAQAWVTVGAAHASGVGISNGGFSLLPKGSATPAVNYLQFKDALAAGPGLFAQYVWTWLGNAFTDYYYGGNTQASYLGVFGWMDTHLTIVSPDVDSVVRSLAKYLTVLLLVLGLVRFAQVTVRLVGLVRNSRWRVAVRIAFGNPLLTGYFLFTIFMFLLYVATANTFGAQARNWLPYILASFFAGIFYAPKALPFRALRVAFSRALIVAVALYAAVAAYYSVHTVQARFYETSAYTSPSTLVHTTRVRGYTAYSIDLVDGQPVTGKSLAKVTASVSQEIDIHGWAVDSQAHDAAGGVLAVVDGSETFGAYYGGDRPDVASAAHEPAYEHSGFDVFIPPNTLGPGLHRIRLDILTARVGGYYEPAQQIEVDIP